MAGVRAAVPAPLLTPHIRWQKEPPLSGGFFACGCSQAGHGLIGVGRQACAGTTARRGPALTAGRENPRGSSTARSSRPSQGAVGGYLGSKPTRLRGFCGGWHWAQSPLLIARFCPAVGEPVGEPPEHRRHRGVRASAAPRANSDPLAGHLSIHPSSAASGSRTKMKIIDVNHAAKRQATIIPMAFAIWRSIAESSSTEGRNLSVRG
jgi:hypothetical protein